MICAVCGRTHGPMVVLLTDETLCGQCWLTQAKEARQAAKEHYEKLTQVRPEKKQKKESIKGGLF